MAKLLSMICLRISGNFKRFSAGLILTGLLLFAVTSGCSASAGGVSADTGNIVVDFLLVVTTVIVLYISKNFIDLLFELWKLKLTKKIESDFRAEEYPPLTLRNIVKISAIFFLLYLLAIVSISVVRLSSPDEYFAEPAPKLEKKELLKSLDTKDETKATESPDLY